MLKIYIHIGPPKTGTSALQNWFLSNRAWLLGKGIYYPNHSIDSNGVSSGHVECLFDRDSNNELHFSAVKLADVLEKATKSSAQSLLLSSEFFFRRLPSILTKLPQAKIIAYVRNPLDVIESSYNQSVKRHFQTEVIKITNAPKSTSLHALDKLVQQYGKSCFILRPYDFTLFVGNNIVSDFLFALNVDSSDITIKKEKINSSYIFEALEFKRWFNQIENKELHSRLDYFCQGYLNGDSQYTLLPSGKKNAVGESVFPLLEKFCFEYGLISGEKFLENVLKAKSKKSRVQNISEEEFSLVFYGFLNSKLVSKKFIKDVFENVDIKRLERPEFYSIVKANTLSKTQFLKRLLSRIFD